LALVFVYALFTLFTVKVEAASISGRVTNISGEPIEQASVDLYWHTGTVPGSWVPGETVVTNANGEYTLASLNPGTYRLGFGHASSLYIYEYYNNQTSLETATNIVLANNNSTLNGYDVVLSSHGRVVGKVLDSENNPIQDIIVLRLDENGGYTEVVTDDTDASGDFELHLTNNDPFLLWFRHELYDYIGEYYDNAYTFDEADALMVLPDQVITVTVHLSRSKTISGTVTDSFGNPIGAEVVLYQKGDFDQWNMREHVYTSGPDGRYQFPKLPRGQFRLGFSGSEIVQEYYNNESTFENADIIDLVNAPTVSTINAVVSRRGIAKGSVTDASGTPLGSIIVSLYYRQGNEWVLQEQVFTESNGRYQFLQASPGLIYIIEFNSEYDRNPAYPTEYYNNASTSASATKLSFAENSTLSNINAVLRQENEVEADFFASLRSNSFVVNFVDHSSGNVLDEEWNFGDGEESDERNPTHIYEEPGVYNVTLTVDGPINSHQVTKSITVGMTSFDYDLWMPFTVMAE
jgi:5-hydroxyisourate hydrolase-like protein (transthyretin family)